VTERDLDWPGCYNFRDLGGLPTASGRRTRRTAVVRGDSPDRLTAAGWAALWAYGVRTVIDLRNDNERGSGATPRPAGLTTVHLPLDDLADTEFWSHWGNGSDCTPLYYPAFLERFPDTAAGVIAAVADARPGGVLIHCAGGRDRTGLITLLLLALVGVFPEDIAADYALSNEQLARAWKDLDLGDQNDKIEALLARHNTTVHESVLTTVTSLDVETYLRRGGLTEAQLAAIRNRLLEALDRRDFRSADDRKGAGPGHGANPPARPGRPT
jgi:protein-tyrosine phosphatase